MEGLKLVRRTLHDLPKRTPNLREYIVGIRADQSDCAHHNYEDYSEHHRILGNVLSPVIQPNIAPRTSHDSSPGRATIYSVRRMSMPGEWLRCVWHKSNQR